MQIRAKLTLQFTLLVSVIVLAIFGLIYWLRLNYIEDEFYKRLTQKASTITKLYLTIEKVNSKKLLKKIQKANYDVFYRENLFIYDYNKTEFFSLNDTIRYKTTTDFLDRILKKRIVRLKQKEYKIVGMYHVDRYNKFIAIAGAEDLAGQKDLEYLKFIMIWLFLGTLILVSVAGWYFAARALSPISEVIQQVQSIYPQNVNQRLTIQNPKDEKGKLKLLKSFWQNRD